MFFPVRCSSSLFVCFLRFYEHASLHKVCNKHKNYILIFPYKWLIFRKKETKLFRTVLHTRKEGEDSPFLALMSVTHAEPSEASHTRLSVGAGGRHRRGGAASEKYTQNVESFMKSTSYFLRHQTVSITKRKKGGGEKS